ncbi:hypothetical protein MJA45_28270 [Paenibacillus aurantius]|uniref:Butirosin biosynthesis protein H N-terminal domain-containing protein n=1 Tax=Paenibacillus aurantius TaxID=2918900 RepID=A0AA96LDQ8_9BACL|nr:hypothetical protein [Paenibacillus aurantius]WNQ11445.1 hypothetical protein MJA45_28270 [Paenibacillus aurantius]
MFAYVGNGAYCYANSTSMLLAPMGEPISPSLIEVLTGVGLGAVWFEEDNMIFFSNGIPHQGVSKALDLLGFTYKECSGKEERGWIEQLSAELREHPILMGPLDMGFLSYLPNHPYLHGCDHYVLAFGLEDGWVRLHDPAGYPFAALPVHDLIRASRTSRLQYRLYPNDLTYHYWTAPVRLRQRTSIEMYREAIPYFQEVYTNADRLALEHGWITGTGAFAALSRHVQGGKMDPGLQGHLTHFAFQVGARRALDFSEFFQSYNRQLSELKGRQAEWFGSCHSLAVRGDWHAVGEAVRSLGELEQEFRELLFRE